MNDRELLEWAAKAAGLPTFWDEQAGRMRIVTDNGKTFSYWQPLTDDGDALRLAVDLCLRIFPTASTTTGYACSAVADGANMRISEVVATGDTRADTRRAIVRAAAAIAQQRGEG